MNSSSDAFAESRLRMVEFQLRHRGIADQRVLEAMARVPRHEFAPQRYIDQAYEDHPLSIGEGQTISQPYIVALMLEALAIEENDRVLEVGTGSGYVTALLAELAHDVISIERHAALANAARQLLARRGYKNINVITGDGSQGYAPCSPYNAVLVSAAALEIPSALLSQLAEGGRLIIPVGSEDAQQLQFVRMEGGHAEIEFRELCRFVPLLPGVDE
ncbi:MAG TPA: protein-L-isoaspartate(D-aspartate) O-methyltransferase [Verrucomicrobiae bacterium]|jgi:protein-L-isoaspartate(D-aspartate) O-methyltransferase|nr:protein-L-isoaspartate(D-aspartate) O-methyltransferase [Verrucomicrobiae bacterium]